MNLCVPRVCASCAVECAESLCRPAELGELILCSNKTGPVHHCVCRQLAMLQESVCSVLVCREFVETVLLDVPRDTDAA